MGLPRGVIPPILWLLFLQLHVGGSTDTTPLLGCSHITNALQVYFHQGVYLCIYLLNVYSGGHKLLVLYFPLLSFVLQLDGDDRSDEEEDDSDLPKERHHKLKHINGSGARGRANGH